MDAQIPTTQQVFRQRSSLGLAAACGVTGVILLVSLARNWAAYPRPLSAAWVIFGLAVAWSVFVRPAALLTLDGVVLRNVLRDVHIPWSALTDVSSRWNLRVSAGDRGYNSWAISSQVKPPRRASGGMFRMPVPGRLDGIARAEASAFPTVAKVTAQVVARSIRTAKEEYDKAVALGQLHASPDAAVRVTWALPTIAALLVLAVVVLALSLG